MKWAAAFLMIAFLLTIAILVRGAIAVDGLSLLAIVFAGAGILATIRAEGRW